jgi:hypothetical protein
MKRVTGSTGPSSRGSKNLNTRTAARGLVTVAFWQFAAFSLLLILVWVNEYLDLPALIYGASRTEPSLVRGCLFSAGVLLTAIIAVGNTYVQQRRILSGFLVVCSKCHKVKLKHEMWKGLECYISQHSELVFSHGLCPICYREELALLQAQKEAYERRRPSVSDQASEKDSGKL